MAAGLAFAAGLVAFFGDFLATFGDLAFAAGLAAFFGDFLAALGDFFAAALGDFFAAAGLAAGLGLLLGVACVGTVGSPRRRRDVGLMASG